MLGEISEKIEEIVKILKTTEDMLIHISRNIAYFEPLEKTTKANEVYDNLYKVYKTSLELILLLGESYKELYEKTEGIYISQLMEFLSDLYITVEITLMFIKGHIIFAPAETNKQAISGLVPRLHRFSESLKYLSRKIR